MSLQTKVKSTIPGIETILQQIPPSWSLTPVRGKAPIRQNWQIEPAMAHPELVEAVSNGSATGLGLRLGRYSGGVVAIDKDGISSIELIQNLSGDALQPLPLTVALTSGREGRGVDFYWVPEEYWDSIQTRKFKTAVEGEGLEFRWDKTQQVIWGRHPSGSHYTWLPGRSPSEIEIAECPQWVIEKMLIPVEVAEISTPKAAAAPLDTNKSFFSRGWARFEAEFQLPCQFRPPLDVVLAKSTREILEGSYSVGRNDAGAKLARDLIGTANYLDQLGQAYDGDPQQIFNEWCSRVGLDKDNPARQPENIWRSAQKANPKPALPTGFILGCIRAWVWKQNKTTEYKQQWRGRKMLFGDELGETIQRADEAEDDLLDVESSFNAQADIVDDIKLLLLDLQSQAAELRDTAARDDSLTVRSEAKAQVAELTAEIATKKKELSAATIILSKLRREKQDKRKAWNAAAREKRAVEKDFEKTTPFARDWQKLNELFEEGESLRYNQLTQTIEYMGVSLPLEHPRSELTDLFPGEENWNTGEDSVAGIVMFLAKKHSYCPIVAYLESAKEVHPEVDHTYLDDLAFRIFGIQDPIQNKYLKIALLGSVARAYTPGCKFQYLPILLGRQNQGKSTFIKALYGEQFASEGFLDMSDKDSLLTISRSWVHELAEIDRSFSNKEAPVMKAFITREKDTFRAPYARQSKDFPRRTIIWGTTNIDELLTDETGNRRYLIIDIPSETEDGEINKINLRFIEENRDKIWAAAVNGIEAGLKPMLTPEELQETELRNQVYRDDDVWTDPIVDYVWNQQRVTIQDILTNVLKIDLGSATKFDKIRVARVLRSVGWENKPTRINGAIRKVWVRVRTVLDNLPVPEPVLAAAFSARDMILDTFRSVITTIRDVSAPVSAPAVNEQSHPVEQKRVHFNLGDLVRVCQGDYKLGKVGRVAEVSDMGARVKVNFGGRKGFDFDLFPGFALEPIK